MKLDKTVKTQHNKSELMKSTSKIVPSKKVVVIEEFDVKPSTSKIEYVAEKRQLTGKIVAIGEGKMPVPMKIGNVIAFRRFGEDKLLLDNKEYLFVTFPDILGVIK